MAFNRFFDLFYAALLTFDNDIFQHTRMCPKDFDWDLDDISAHYSCWKRFLRIF